MTASNQQTGSGFIQLRRRGSTVEHRKLSKRPWSDFDGEWSPWTVRRKRLRDSAVYADLRPSLVCAPSHDGEWGLTP